MFNMQTTDRALYRYHHQTFESAPTVQRTYPTLLKLSCNSTLLILAVSSVCILLLHTHSKQRDVKLFFKHLHLRHESSSSTDRTLLSPIHCFPDLRCFAPLSGFHRMHRTVPTYILGETPSPRSEIVLRAWCCVARIVSVPDDRLLCLHLRGRGSRSISMDDPRRMFDLFQVPSLL